MAKTDDLTASRFNNALSELKLERLTALTEAAGLQVAMQSLLYNEAQRLENKLGSQHRRTRELKASLETNLLAAQTLEVERQLTRINVPEVAGEGALVHGRIVDEDGLGIDRLIVCLVDKSGVPSRDSAEPISDISGYFAILLEPDMVNRLLKQYSDGIFLAVFTPRRRLVYQRPKPLTLAHGAALEMEILLDRDTLTARPSKTPTTIVTPNLIGMTESEGLATLQKFGLKLGERNTKVAPDQVGRVLEQSPAGGAKVELGASVSLMIGVNSNANPKPEMKVPQSAPVIKDILKRMATDEAFLEIGASVAKLEKRMRKFIDTKEQLASLLESSELDLKGSLGLPNLNAATVFKSVLRKVLAES